MIRRPPRSTLFPYTNALPISNYQELRTMLGVRAPREKGAAAPTGDLVRAVAVHARPPSAPLRDRKSTRLNSSHGYISYAVFCLKKKKRVAVSTVTVPRHSDWT